MRFKVTLEENNALFDEIIIANNKEDAVLIAKRNNPKASVVKSDWTYKM